MFAHLQRTLNNREGSVLVIMVVSMTAVFAVMALAIDMGMLFSARSEAQRAADAGALAGTVALIEDPEDPARAKQIAARVANANKVQGDAVEVLPEDVTIVMDQQDTVVYVDVIRSSARGKPVKTWFAKTIGIDEVDVAASAGAKIMATGSTTCIKPFIVPDMWDDANGNGSYDAGEYYSPHETGFGSTWRTDLTRDVGREVTLYPGQPDQTITAGWYFLFRMPGSQGGNDIRTEIANPDCVKQTLTFGDYLDVDREPGRKTGPVTQGINDLINLDPGAYWDAATGTVRGSLYGDAWPGSPRVISIVTFDPTQTVQPGMRPIGITNFITVFLEKSVSGRIFGRYLPTVGVSEPGDCRLTGTCAPGVRYARLIR